MLARLQLMVVGDLFTKQRKSAEMIPELGECFQKRGWRRRLISQGHKYIVSRCIVIRCVLMLNASLGTAGTFWVYAGVCALGFFGVKRWLPETKGKKLEEIDGFWT
jgi:hypothetical protein